MVPSVLIYSYVHIKSIKSNQPNQSNQSNPSNQIKSIKSIPSNQIKSNQSNQINMFISQHALHPGGISTHDGGMNAPRTTYLESLPATGFLWG